MNRRKFLHSTGAALACVPGFRGSEARAAALKVLDEPDFVRLAVATICTDGFGNHRHEPAFRLIPQTGVRNVEFNIWYDELLAPEYLDGIVARCAAAGLMPVCVQGSAFGGEGAAGIARDVAHKFRLMEAARRLGCRRVKCTGARRGTKGGLESVIAVCREIAPAAREMGVLVVLENHAGNVLENVADYDTIFGQIDSPHIGLCLDTGHFEGAGIPLAEVVERFHSRLLHVDLKDCQAFGKGHSTVVYGDGVTDFEAFLDLLAAKAYRGYLVMEQAWAEPREPIVDNLLKGVKRFRPYERQG